MGRMQPGTRLKKKDGRQIEATPRAISRPSAGDVGQFEPFCAFGMAVRCGAFWRNLGAVGWNGSASTLGDANGAAPKRRQVT